MGMTMAPSSQTDPSDFKSLYQWNEMGVCVCVKLQNKTQGMDYVVYVTLSMQEHQRLKKYFI